MKIFKKVLGFVLIAVIAVTGLAGCNQSAPATVADTKQVLVIGGSGPLTGSAASYGNSVKQGAQMAVDEINAKGGVEKIKFELQFEDDQATPAMAVNAYATLVDAGMQVSLGCVTSGACVAVTEEVKKDGFLMITPSASQQEATQYDNCFRVCFTDAVQGTYAADFIQENKLASKVAIIYDKSSDYSSGITNTFAAEAEKVGLNVVTKQAFTDQSKTDFSVQIQAVQNSGADLLFLPIYYQEAAMILTQSTDLNVIYFGVDGMDGIIAQMGKENAALTEGVMLLTPFAADAKDDQTVAFVAAYKKAYESTPDQFAADAYDAVYTFAAAMEQAKITTVDDKEFNAKMVAAMTKITVDGLTGTMTWNAAGEPTKSATAVVIKDGTYVAYTK
ncbi:MAG TPA: ABC transporter substrate-binding protein [Bacillota bacterium]|nr:ABC transporter substrate-binding protein [Bacillota bacterium]